MARDCLVIRATNKGPAEMELARLLGDYFGRHIYFALDGYSNRDEGVTFSGGSEISIGGQFLREHGIPYFKRLGWQCGDICLYAAAQTVPFYDYYWLIEPDVGITLEYPGAFFRGLSERTDDFIGSTFRRQSKNWVWHKTMASLYDGIVYGSAFPFSRLSFRAVQYLFDRRRDYFHDPAIRQAATSKDRSLIANDEAFVSTTLAHNGFSCERLAKLCPSAMSRFYTGVPIHIDELPFLSGRIIHPVCDDRRFAHKFARVHRSNRALAIARMKEFILNLGEQRWLEVTSIAPADLQAEAA